MIPLCMQGQLLSFNDDSAYIDLAPSQASLIRKVREYVSNTRRKVKILIRKEAKLNLEQKNLKSEGLQNTFHNPRGRTRN